jgi:hypothetical protein
LDLENGWSVNDPTPSRLLALLSSVPCLDSTVCLQIFARMIEAHGRQPFASLLPSWTPKDMMPIIEHLGKQIDLFGPGMFEFFHVQEVHSFRHFPLLAKNMIYFA